MTTFNADLVPQIAARCEAAIGDISQALSRAFGAEVYATLGRTGTLPDDGVDASLAEPGLIFVLHVAEQAAVVLLPKSSGLLPEWYDKPDAESQKTLNILAHELGMVLLPEAYLPDRETVGAVGDLRAACQRGGFTGGEGFINLDATSGDARGALWMIWPVKPDEFPAQAATTTVTRNETATVPEVAIHQRCRSLSDLPSYTRSLLKIRVPLTVTLAQKKQPIEEILELGPGSIIQFDKSCEEMLDLNVANLPIARGEAVKVGEKFGLRVTSLVLPGERFKPVGPACK